MFYFGKCFFYLRLFVPFPSFTSNEFMRFFNPLVLPAEIVCSFHGALPSWLPASSVWKKRIRLDRKQLEDLSGGSLFFFLKINIHYYALLRNIQRELSKNAACLKGGGEPSPAHTASLSSIAAILGRQG